MKAGRVVGRDERCAERPARIMVIGGAVGLALGISSWTVELDTVEGGCSRESMDNAEDCVCGRQQCGCQFCSYFNFLRSGRQMAPGEQVQGVLILQVSVIKLVDGIVSVMQGSNVTVPKFRRVGISPGSRAC